MRRIVPLLLASTAVVAVLLITAGARPAERPAPTLARRSPAVVRTSVAPRATVSGDGHSCLVDGGGCGETACAEEIDDVLSPPRGTLVLGSRCVTPVAHVARRARR